MTGMPGGCRVTITLPVPTLDITRPRDPAQPGQPVPDTTRRASVRMTDDQYQFTLPFHKADRLFTGNEVLVQQTTRLLNPIFHFKRYLASRDRLLPLLSPLWLRSNGAVPTRSFFIRRLRVFLPSSFWGQSMRARGATWLAEQG